MHQNNTPFDRPVYLSLLRGINVGGHNKIKMTDIKDLYESLGFKNIQTYIQSGNIIFETTILFEQAVLAEIISRAITEKYGYYVPVIVRSHTEMLQVEAENSFWDPQNELYMGNNEVYNLEHSHLIFLAKPPLLSNIVAATEAANASLCKDKFVVFGANVYLYCMGNYSETKLSNKFFEKQFCTQATTRNWKTVLQLVKMFKN